MDKYAKLNKVDNYDKEAVEQLAEAANEATRLESEAAGLRDLIDENKELFQYAWKTADGKVIAIHLIEDDHFKNILQHMVNNRRSVSKIFKAEARKRGFPIPTHYLAISNSRSNRALNAEVIEIDDKPIDLSEIPF